MTTGSILPLKLAGIDKIFGRQVVLRGLDLELAAGEVVGLIGANGSGKTTLFNLMVGLDQPDGGTISFGGRTVEDIDASLRARIAHVAHATQLYPLLSGRENLELFGRLAAASGDAPAAADPVETLTRMGLERGAVDRPVQTYSRGMKQRTALARALASQASVLVLDEPFTALDAPGRRLLAEVLRDEAERGAAVLLSSHDLDALATAATRVVLLAGGRIADQVSATDPTAMREGASALLARVA